MASDHKQPLSVNKRVRFYDGQFLQDQDLIDEQKYHIGQLSRHRRSLHVAGVVEGLEVTARFADDDEPAAPGAGSSRLVGVTVGSGAAVDADGRLIQLLSEAEVAAVGDELVADPGWLLWLYVAYHQVATDVQASDEGVSGETRWTEEPYLFLTLDQLGPGQDYEAKDWNEYLPADAGPPPPVLLARVPNARGPGLGVDLSVRAYSGLRLAGPFAPASLRTDAGGSLGFHLARDAGEVGEVVTVTPGGDLRLRGGELTVSSGGLSLGDHGDPLDTTANDGRNVSFLARPADGEALRTAGRIHGDATLAVPGEHSNRLVLQAATDWGEFTDSQLVLKAGGNVGVGVADPRANLHLGGEIMGSATGGALRIQSFYGHVEVGPRDAASGAAFVTDRDSFSFNKPLRIDGGIVGSASGDLRLQVAGADRLVVREGADIEGDRLAVDELRTSLFSPREPSGTSFTFATGPADLRIGASQDGISLSASNGALLASTMSIDELTVRDGLTSANDPFTITLPGGRQLSIGSYGSDKIELGGTMPLRISRLVDLSVIETKSLGVRFQRNTWGTLGIFHREINNNSSASMLAIGLEDGADFVTIGEDGTNTGPGELPTHLRVHGTLIARNAVVTESPTFTNKSRVAQPLRMIAGTVDTSGAIKQGTGFTVQRLNAGNAAPGQTFKVNFDDEFDGAPSFVVTVVGESNFYPTDNAVVIDRQPGYCQVKTGNLDSTTTGSYRSFSFVAVGNVKEA